MEITCRNQISETTPVLPWVSTDDYLSILDTELMGLLTKTTRREIRSFENHIYPHKNNIRPTGIVINMDDNEVDNLKRAIACLGYRLREAGLSLVSQFNTSEIVSCIGRKYNKGIHPVPLQMIFANNICSTKEPLPGVEVLWTLVFNLNVCASLGKDIPDLYIPGIAFTEYRCLHVYRVGHAIHIDVRDRSRCGEIMYPKFASL